MNNNFAKLAAIDVSKHIEKKAGLSYLSWSWAVDQLMRVDPEANWVFHEPQMYGETMMVSCTVTAFGKPITMHLPVMDHRNKAVPNPDAFIVNKAMMRCLVKGIACHGLGLYIYSGEDLPSEQDITEQTITNEQTEYLQAYIDTIEVNASYITEKMKINSLSEIPAKKYDAVLKRLAQIKTEKEAVATEAMQ